MLYHSGLYHSMLRDKNLIPLSHQHQRALALCVRIDRAQPIPESDLMVWQSEICQLFEQEIEIHFGAEEEIVFPAARAFPELSALAEELVEEHASLRGIFLQAAERQLSAETLVAFTQQLSAHIRKEERQLFEGMQRLMNAEELLMLGVKLELALRNANQSCSLPNSSTRLRPRQQSRES